MGSFMGIKGMMFTSAECLRELGLLFQKLLYPYRLVAGFDAGGLVQPTFKGHAAHDH
jgi:hypothetical protein